uniref:Ovule protein n=1 Tax=Angiostrongylus cantonensis TaxID=6313 RepID=A0A0K0DEQ1_ANGCA
MQNKELRETIDCLLCLPPTTCILKRPFPFQILPHVSLRYLTLNCVFQMISSIHSWKNQQLPT